ncbi:MAG TPA: hypothetical protein PKC49_13995 [Phycisphaerae bacterium]|nr:hypothetical protein [Phycisphaerae bacterium]
MTQSWYASAQLVEAAFWILGGVAALLGSLLKPRGRTLGLAGALVLVVFGLSDVVEARTGAWWRPWWLLAWKAACVAAMAWIAALAWRVGRSSADSAPSGRSPQRNERQQKRQG